MSDWKSKIIPGGVLIVVAGGIALLIGRTVTKHGTPDAAALSAASAQAPAEPESGWRGEPPPKAQTFDLQEDPHFKAGIPLRSMDKEIFDRLKDPNLTRDDLADLLPNKPYRARAVGSVELKVYGAVLIDEDRDGKWDERWTLKGDQVIRTSASGSPTSPSDPEQLTLSHGRWQAR
jgi:hypothetical protein